MIHTLLLRLYIYFAFIRIVCHKWRAHQKDLCSGIHMLNNNNNKNNEDDDMVKVGA